MADPTLPGPQIPAAPSSPSPRVPSPWMVGLVGAVVGALVAGIPLLLTRSSDGGSGGLGASHESLSAPAALADYTPAAKNNKVDPATIKRITTTETTSTKNLSDAYGGATAVVRQYTDASLQNWVTLEAVRAESPKPYYPYVDPAQIGMAKPDQDVETFGQVNCLVHYTPVAQGQPEPPDQVLVMTCERTSAHLTVRLRFASGDAWHSPADAAALTDKAWSQLA
ncbi:hypothetical protein [Catenulispora subtropica]|uniref:Serine/threonine protein kinase n=1 Tax=Catenulispora subtropica TaxID=450798 RepID=A0ABP5D3T6_9ACTN